MTLRSDTRRLPVAAHSPVTATTLANGLRVLVHEDRSTPVVSVNVLYHVGSKDESPGRRGFAHLFEHLMFDGSPHIERGGYDSYCTLVGGENNAFTTPDVTNYFLMLPGSQIELGLWLESDRMSGCAIEAASLETQKKVVLEEKQQTVDDAPYADALQWIRSLAYAPDHPYSWETIGVAEDIERATLEDVHEFYRLHYRPSNAVLVVAGDLDTEPTLGAIERYFGPIAASPPPPRRIVDATLLRTGGSMRRLTPQNPLNAVFVAFHLPPLNHPDIPALELLAAVLADGESSRFYRVLEYETSLASETDAFVDEGELGSLFHLYAVAQDNRIGAKRLAAELLAQLRRVAEDGVQELELQKVKNQRLTRIAASLQSVSTRAERLAWFAAVANRPALAFTESELFENVTREDIRRVARTYFSDVEPAIVEYRIR